MLGEGSTQLNTLHENWLLSLVLSPAGELCENSDAALSSPLPDRERRPSAQREAVRVRQKIVEVSFSLRGVNAAR